MATREQVAAFQREHWPHALAVAQQTGMDPRIVMAQAGFETGWGTSVPGNNYFGIKGGSGPALATQEAGPDGKLVPTQASFQQFDTPAHSYAAYANLPVIQTVGKLPYVQQAAALQKMKYGTDPDYAAKINGTASSLTLPTDVTPTQLPLPGQTVNGPGAGAGPTAGAAPQTPSLLAADTGSEPWNDPDINKRLAASDQEISDWSKMGETPNNYAAAGKGLTSIGTSMMMSKPEQPHLLAKESANIPQARGQGNPSYAQSAAQLALLRRQRQQQEE